MKRTRLFSVALLAAAWLAGGSAQAWDEPAKDADGVYQIGTASELEWYAEYVNSCVDGDTDGNNAKLMSKAVLTADIDMTGVTHTPIGASTTFKYDGEFDGQHHCIKNMIIDLPEQENVGLFGLVRGNAVIKNIIIDSTCSIKGKNRVAAIIGCNQTVADKKLAVLNCVNMAPVHAYSGVAAGIIGAGQSQYPYFRIHNCVNTGAITTDATNNWTVAFHGWNNSAGGNAEVWSCYNIGTLSRIDGGNNLFRGVNRSVLNSYDLVNTASNMQSQTNIPSVGFQTADPLHSGELCYYLNHGIEMMGRSEVTIGEEFTQDLSDPNSIPMPNAAGPKVYQVADLYCDGTPKGSIVYSNTDGGSQDPHQFDATGYCTVCGAINPDFIVAQADGFYHLSTVAEVEWFSAMVKAGYGAMNVKLDADIDYQGVPDAHMPIGTSAKKYFGHFDGQGHRIKGMVLTPASRLENRGYDGNGFFGSVRGGGTSVDNITNNEVIIENLIIDASCSIQHDQNFAAGLVAHINSRNDNDSHIIIRYCGNEANVSSTGKNIAGILGCVEATEVGLTIKQCYNTGNIYGGAGESAAICAWTGTPKDYLVKEFSGCWNIGEVTGIDGNGYNLVRAGKLNNELYPAVVNSVDLCTTNGGNQGKVAINTADPVASGELCYLLNGDQSTITWTQDLGVEDMPNMWGTTSQVYQAGTVNCAGVSVGSLSYNNISGETQTLPHNINDDMGMCDVCYTQFQEPALVDGYYELKNAGNVEWFGQYVAAAGGNHSGAKLMNDIDFYNIENLHSPIGPNEQNKFNSTFDGQGYSIKNMIIERPTESNVGFFGWLRGNNAPTTVKNLVIDGSCSIHGYNRVGGITGTYQNGGSIITIENVINEANVTAEHQDAGGIFGGHQAGNPTIIIRNVLNTGTITAKNEHPYAGAICCYLGVDAATSVIENFVNLGTINGHEGGNMGRHNITNVTNLIDLSDTNPDGSTAAPNAGFDSGLTKDDIANGKLAYTVGWGQFLGVDAYPTPLSGLAPVSYVGDAGYATLYDTTTGYVLKGDVEAYVAQFDGQFLDLVEIENVPESTPVVLKGTYYNKFANDLPAINIANDLKGADADIAADGTMYILANGSEGIGFYKATGTIAAGKAYFQSANSVKAFFFSGDDATGIETIDHSPLTIDQPIYNIAGQRLQKMQKGINIINGKKVLK